MPEARPTGAMFEAWGLYRRFLRKYFSTVDLAGLAADDEPLALRQIYVPLVLTPILQGDENPEDRIHLGGHSVEKWLEDAYDGAEDSTGREVVEYGKTEWRKTSWRSHRTLLISGEAGSGKTTLLRSLVTAFAGDEANPLATRFRGFVPFPLVLREAPVRELPSLEGLVEWWLDQVKKEERRLEVGPLRTYLDRGWGLLLLDGLDEVGSVEQRQRVLEWARRSSWCQGSNANLTVVTGRPTGFEGLKAARRDHSTFLHVAPFSRQQVREYLDRWFRLRPMVSARRDEVVESLLVRLTSEAEANRLRPLARRPAYLAALAFVHGTRGELPHSRPALYELLIDAYIDILDRHRGLEEQRRQAGLPVWDRREKIQILSAVAAQAHLGAPSLTRQGRRFEFSKQALEEAVLQAIDYYGEDRFRTVRREHAIQLTDYFRARTGLLVERRENHYQFGHLSLQEFLVATFVLTEASTATNKQESLARSLLARLSQPGWQEIAILVILIEIELGSVPAASSLLATLSLGFSHHVELIGRLLGGDELKLSTEERHDLVVAWCLGLAAGGDEHPTPVVRRADNTDGLLTSWRATCQWLAEDASSRNLAAAFRSTLAQGIVPDSTHGTVARDPLSALASNQTTRLRRLTAGKKLLDQFAGRDVDGDIILILPLLTKERPRIDSTSMLLKAADAQNWQWDFDGQKPEFPAHFAVFEPWAQREPALRARIIQKAPLLWGLALDEFYLGEILSGLTHVPPLVRWRINTWKTISLIERWQISAKRSLTEDSFWRSTARGSFRIRSTARDFDIQIQSHAPEEDGSFRFDFDRERYLKSIYYSTWLRTRDDAMISNKPLRYGANTLPRTLSLDGLEECKRALEVDWGWTPCIIPALAVSEALRSSEIYHGMRAIQDRLSNISDRLNSLSMIEYEWDAQEASTVLIKLSTMALDPVFQQQDLQPSRETLIGKLTELRTTPALDDAIKGSDRRQAQLEWSQLTASRLCPITALQDCLSLEFDRLDASTDSLLSHIELSLKELEERSRHPTSEDPWGA